MRILFPDLPSVHRILLSCTLVAQSVSVSTRQAAGSSTCPEHQQVQIEKHGQHIGVWPVWERVRDGRLNKLTDILDYLLLLAINRSSSIRDHLLRHAYHTDQLREPSPLLDTPPLVFPVRCKRVVHYAECGRVSQASSRLAIILHSALMEYDGQPDHFVGMASTDRL